LETVRRVAARELARHPDRKAAVKATKRRLHQVYGAFEEGIDYEAVLKGLQRAYQTGSQEVIKATCREALALHSSTRERLPDLEQFYSQILAATGRPQSILDLGCGLNPLALPWMNLAPGARVIALDIDAARVDLLNGYLLLAGFPPLARCQDILSQVPDEAADLALLLKMSPTLERQEPGSTVRLLRQLQTDWAVVSFATRSLGGQSKGMLKAYQQTFLTAIKAEPWAVTRLAFASELVFVVRR